MNFCPTCNSPTQGPSCSDDKLGRYLAKQEVMGEGELRGALIRVRQVFEDIQKTLVSNDMPNQKLDQIGSHLQRFMRDMPRAGEVTTKTTGIATTTKKKSAENKSAFTKKAS